MAGSIQIFSIELVDRASGARLALAAGREFDPACFYLDFGDFMLRLAPDQAQRFAFAVRRLSRRQRTKKAGPVWTRQLGDSAGPNITLAFGIADDGLAYVEAGSVKIVCDEAQTDDLLHVLDCFAEDIDAIGRASEPPPRPYSASDFYVPKWR
jgi:hypothetical protein